MPQDARKTWAGHELRVNISETSIIHPLHPRLGGTFPFEGWIVPPGKTDDEVWPGRRLRPAEPWPYRRPPGKSDRLPGACAAESFRPYAVDQGNFKTRYCDGRETKSFFGAHSQGVV